MPCSARRSRGSGSRFSGGEVSRGYWAEKYQGLPIEERYASHQRACREDKDFDLLVLPGANHHLMNKPFVLRRKWDCFVRHLMGAAPPAPTER
jgi:hypothetical protein